MAKSLHANNLIKELKASLTLIKNEEAKYYEKFITNKVKPTQNDVAAYEKHLKAMKSAANLFHADVEEIRAAIAQFGGPGDTMIFGAETMLKTLKKSASTD